MAIIVVAVVFFIWQFKGGKVSAPEKELGIVLKIPAAHQLKIAVLGVYPPAAPQTACYLQCRFTSPEVSVPSLSAASSCFLQVFNRLVSDNQSKLTR